MKIPQRRIGQFVGEIIRQCSVSMKLRAQQAEVYQNYFLTGSADGNPATFPKTYAYIDNLASYLYSPVELRFRVSPRRRSASAADLAKAKAASDELNVDVEMSSLDLEIEQAVLWSLVLGKTFVKVLWNGVAFEGEMVRPENIGVLRDDIDSLDKQEAFFHLTWVTRSRFAELLENHPDATELLRKASRYFDLNGTVGSGGQPMTPLMLGGQAFTYPTAGPYTSAGSGGRPTGNQNQNVAYWLSSQPPQLDAEVRASLIPLFETWVWDSSRDDWATFQTVGDDLVIEGGKVIRNLFSDAIDPANTERRRRLNSENPLAERQPFREFCANPIKGNMWGRSEIKNVGFLQDSINSRVNGINMLERRQEDPPTFLQGFNGNAATAKSRISKPGGFLTDTSPNAKLQQLIPEIPEHIYSSLHERERMFDEMGGMPDVMRGHGDRGVRSHKQVETLTRNASPRFKDRALLIERQVAAVGMLCHRIQRAKLDVAIVAWIKPNEQSIQVAPTTDPTLEPPAPGMKPIEFLLHQLPDDWRVTVDSHSSSPAFMYEEEQKTLALAQAKVIGPENLIDIMNPPHRDELIIDAARREAAQEQLAREHPELLAKGKKK